MQPALPDRPGDREGEPPADEVWFSADEVGEFSQGSAFSRWALARYMVGRAIAESVGSSLLIAAVLVLGLGALCEWVLHSTFLAVLMIIAAGVILLLRAGLRAILRRLTAADRYAPVHDRLQELVKETRADVRRELRRIGMPSRALTLPLLAFRLAGRRRSETLQRLRQFDIERAVPKTRLDELHMLLRSGTRP